AQRPGKPIIRHQVPESSMSIGCDVIACVSQKLVIDCDETFSPVVKPATIRTVLSLAVSRKWPIHQLVVKNTFLNGDLSKTVYMHQPPGFVDPRDLKVMPLVLDFTLAVVTLLYSFLISGQFMSQKQYAIELLARAHMTNYNHSRTQLIQTPNWVLKARLVANGSSQQLGIDCDETFSPVVKPATIRTVLSLAVSHNWPIHQLVIKNTFLNEDLSETLYMHQPPGFVDPRYPHHDFTTTVVTLLYSFFIRDLSSLHNEFDMTDLGALNLFLGISATRHSTWLFLSQKQYAIELLARAHMTTCKYSRTQLIQTPNWVVKVFQFRTPLYIAVLQVVFNIIHFRDQISYAVQQICIYMHDPREPHLAALKRILCYIRGTLDFGFHLYSSTTISIVGYTDADWAGCPSIRRSTSAHPDIEPERMFVENKFYLDNINAAASQWETFVPLYSLTGPKRNKIETTGCKNGMSRTKVEQKFPHRKAACNFAKVGTIRAI
nr:ribonuclease H-like domain-containing protein [Tanacetum cinerariifolium]